MSFYYPIWRELNSPISPQEAFLALRKGQNSFLLESARPHPKTGRYSFAGTEPFLIFKSKGDYIEISAPVHQRISHQERYGNPIQELRKIFSQYKSIRIDGLPNFTAGAVGYFSYDVGRLFEKLPDLQEDDLKLWDIYLAFYDTVVVYDHFENKTIIISNIDLHDNKRRALIETQDKIDGIEERLYNARIQRTVSDIKRSPSFKICDRAGRFNLHEYAVESNFTREGFEEMVMRAKYYIREGDIYQANLSQRLSLSIETDPFSVYQVLARINPSPFACYLDLEDLKIVSSSPERLLKLEGDDVQTRPIAGTRPRGQDPDDDLAKSIELILSEKERAEHIMLLDLERNDLGRVCEYGTVRVDELMVQEYYSHVMHIVSNIRGKLRKDKDRFDILSAIFPGGTITGTPKVRCIELIEELEPVRRGIYTGSIGYLDFNGDMDLNIAIRTILLRDDRAFIQAGSGIVADSDPTKEYYETLYKAEALLEATRRTQRSI